MKPSPDQLAYCLSQVTRFIPRPAAPKVIDRASKFGLKVGQLVAARETGEQFKVVGTDSLGLTLETPDGKICRLENKDELVHYEKVASRRKRKSVSKGVGDTGQIDWTSL